MNHELITEDSLDEITNVLQPYITKSHQTIYVTEHDAVNFLQKMREGLLKVGELYSQVNYQKSQAELRKDRTEARLRLEEFPEFAESKGIVRSTEKDKNAFIVMHADYEQPYNEYHKWSSIAKYLETVRSALYSAMDDVKKNVYSTRHYNNVQYKG